jgi:hypothetical protein
MDLSVYYVFYSQCSNQHVSASIAAIFGVMLLKEHEGTNVVSCIAFTTKHHNTTTPSTHHLHVASELTSLHQASLHTGKGKGHPRTGHEGPEEK